MARAACSYKVAGFEVQFPHQAYGVQKVFINQVLKAIDHEENALLEAPTGCGKTLSLLCGALAWQTAQKQKKSAAEQAKAEAAQLRKAAEEAKLKSLAALGKEVDDAGAMCDVDSPDKAVAEEEEEEPVVVPRIYYATRTHSQIAQVVRELKRTAYRPKMAVLGSRPHYCINNAVIRSGNIDAGCEELNKEERGCSYKKNANTITHGLVKVHDIEDLHKIGKRNKACPYFAARHLADSAELVFCPYSYLLDPNIRRATKVVAADAILVFDEAHNIEDQAREAGSMELDLEQLKDAFIALNLAANMSTESDTYKPLAEAVLRVIQWLMALAEGGTQSAGFRPAGFERFERIWTGQQMLSALAEAGLAPQDVEHLWAMYEQARAAEEKAGFNAEGEAGLEPVDASIKSPKAGGAALGCVSTLLTVLRLMYGTYTEAPSAQPQEQQQLDKIQRPASAKGASAAASAVPKKRMDMGSSGDAVPDYRLAVQMWVPREQHRRDGRDRRRHTPASDSAEAFSAAAPGTSTSSWGLALCLWCLNPAVVFKSLSDVARSVLLASGTLSPLDSFSGELGLQFHVKLEAPHVVDMKRQVMARVVSHGPDGRLMNATFKEADKLDYQDSLGKLTLAVAEAVPDGVLLFLPSYSLMDKLKERWKVTGVWHHLNQLKLVVTEPRKAGDDFDDAIAQYYRAVADGRGGLFMAVCRGKASEGIDFADGNARCVMVVGIPFPNVKDTKVGLKKEYNNGAAAASGRGSSFYGRGGSGPSAAAAAGTPPRLLTGDSWYSQQAFRALNQAVGRCIRHRLDYGAILLVDERFRQPRNQQSLSKWVRSSVSTASNTKELLGELRKFFTGLAANPPGSEAFVNQQQQAAPLELSKPGYEAAAAAAAEALLASKPGFEAAAAEPGHCKPGYEPACGAGMGCAKAGKPGYEPGLSMQCGQGPGMGVGKMQAGFEAGCSTGMSCGTDKPGYEPCAGQLSTATGSCFGVAGAGPGMEPKQQPQQQQPKQQTSRRMSGPMNAFVGKSEQQQSGVKTEHEQQDEKSAVHGPRHTTVGIKQEQQEIALAAAAQHKQQGQSWWSAGPNAGAAAAAGQPPQTDAEQCSQFSGQAGTTAADVRLPVAHQYPRQQQQQQASGTWQQGPMQDWNVQVQQQPFSCQAASCAPQQLNQKLRQPVSCMSVLTGDVGRPPVHPQQQQMPWPQQQHPLCGQQQQQHMGSQQLPRAAGAAVSIKHEPGTAHNDPQQSTTADAANSSEPAASAAPATLQHAADAAAGRCAVPNAAAANGTARVGAGAPAAAAAAGLSSSGTAGQQQPCTGLAPALGAAPTSAAASASDGSAGSSLSAALEQLGLQLPVLQRWVSEDMAAMRKQLQSHGVTDGSHGHSLLQLAAFGIMAALQLALEHCRLNQQQQTQQHGHHASSSSSMASFWPVWHSYVPSGLLAAAAATGQCVPVQHQARVSGQLAGSWMRSMQQCGLTASLHRMAEAYDKALDCFCDQKPQQQILQQWQQQQPWQQLGQQQQQPQQHKQAEQSPPPPSQQQQRAWPQQNAGMQQLQQKQWPSHQTGMKPATAPQGQSTRVPISNSSRQAAATAAAAALGSRVLQLSQTARQPKRAAHGSDRAQLAAQKRSRQQLQLQPPMPAAETMSSSDDDADGSNEQHSCNSTPHSTADKIAGAVAAARPMSGKCSAGEVGAGVVAASSDDEDAQQPSTAAKSAAVAAAARVASRQDVSDSDDDFM